MKRLTPALILLLLAACALPSTLPAPSAPSTGAPSGTLPPPPRTATLTSTITTTSTSTPFKPLPPTTTLIPTPTPIVWPLPPEAYTIYNQYAWEVRSYGLGLNGCGPVAACSAVKDLGYPKAEMGDCLPHLARLALANGYHTSYGIQPVPFYEIVRSVVGGGTLGAAGRVNAIQAESGSAGLEEIRRALIAGEAVIVDILVVSEIHRGGTYPYGVNGPQLPADRINYRFAHFLRVLGFEDGGETLVLAETINPGLYAVPIVVKVSREDFIAAWHTPELRAQFRRYNADPASYWLLTISPPQPYPEPTGPK